MLKTNSYVILLPLLNGINLRLFFDDS